MKSAWETQMEEALARMKERAPGWQREMSEAFAEYARHLLDVIDADLKGETFIIEAAKATPKRPVRIVPDANGFFQMEEDPYQR